MKISHMALRVELMQVGEQLGWPRMGTMRAGQGNWERLSRAKIQQIMPVLRYAKIRRDNLQGQPDHELVRIVTFDDYMKYEGPRQVAVATDDKRQRMLENLAKARATRKAKKEARHAADDVLLGR